MDNYARLKDHLHSHAISFEEIEHPPAASAEEYHNTVGTRYEQQAKALLVRYKKGGQARFIVVALQAHKRADLEQVARLIGAQEIRLASKDQLKEVTGCSFGELPPLGKLFGLQLALDEDLMGEERIFFNACRLDRSISLAPRSLARMEEPILF